MSATILKGVIHGKIIELEQEPGLPEGQPVTVTLEPMQREKPSLEERREALKRAAGSWADDPEGLERFLEWNRQQRKIDRHPIPD